MGEKGRRREGTGARKERKGRRKREGAYTLPTKKSHKLKAIYRTYLN